MPRRRPPAATPFGVWLEQWLLEHDAYTFDSFAASVGVTKAAVSLWISALKPVAVQPDHLRNVAKVTGAELGDLERMVYGQSYRPATIALSEEQLQAMLDRAAETAIRRVLGKG